MGKLRWITLLVTLQTAVHLTSSADFLPVLSNPKPFKNVNMPTIPDSVVEQAFQSGQKDANNRDRIEQQLPANGGIITKKNSAEARHQRLLLVTQSAMKMESNQELFEGAADYLINRYKLSPDQARYGLMRVSLAGSPKARAAVQECQASLRTSCVNSKFRTADGSCNNQQNLVWGRSNTCFDRLLPANYIDGISIPRRSVVNGKALPDPRIISLIIHEDVNIPSRQYSHMTMQWGQFLDHDLTFTPMSRAGDSMMMIECCNTTGELHPECMPIFLPGNDPFFAQFRETCINFVRSATCSDCKLGSRQQTNQLTAYVDASNVYGSNLNDSNGLRSFRNGELRFQGSSFGQLLPQSNDIQNDQCSRPAQNSICFQAGDGRVNEHPGLTTMHTLWLRQHNRVAAQFKRIFPNANDEAIFQETRRLIGAQIQMITWNEFLPVVIGDAYMNYFKLYTQETGNTKYDPNTQGAIVHEFSTAAYRFGHTLIQNTFDTPNGNNQNLNLRDNFFFPFSLYEGELDPILRGLFTQPAQKFDRFIVEAVTDHLYKAREDPFGMDLPALNIQRGRDHGLGSYVDYLDYCFDIKIKKFDDLIDRRIMDRSNVNKLENTYAAVADVDLFAGGVMETPLTGAVVGPTFGCIIGLQFYHLKFGDRYYFEHAEQAGRFSPNKLNEIRQKTTLSSIICKNSGAGLPNIPYHVFEAQTNNSPVRNCRDLPDINYNLWLRDNSE